MEKAVEMERASGIGLFQQLRNAGAAERSQMFNSFAGGPGASPGPVASTNAAVRADLAVAVVPWLPLAAIFAIRWIAAGFRSDSSKP